MQSHHKLRIKIARSKVVKKMQGKFHLLVKDQGTASADDSDNGGTRFTCGSQFSRKSVFSCVLGRQYASKEKKRKSLGDSGNNLLCGDEPVEAAPEETDQTGEGKEKEKEKDRQRVKMNLPLFSFLKKKKGWNNSHGESNNVVKKFGQVRKKASLRHLIRIHSKLLIVRLKLKMIRSLIKKKEKKQFEQEGADENEDRELCKKRILLGERCRPLNSPGYATYSFFLPRAQRHP
ncbi:hypothetical protein VNO78_20480 [Psophocarpus tetragonolobus]|uniref:Uncharacterized protein n=1 Tax=Psophocarpus tetragonolobus TaxID=3891 RepID=A0AAN9SB07_PSOTE